MLLQSVALLNTCRLRWINESARRPDIAGSHPMTRLGVTAGSRQQARVDSPTADIVHERFHGYPSADKVPDARDMVGAHAFLLSVSIQITS